LIIVIAIMKNPVKGISTEKFSVNIFTLKR
jgi:hypothetical protein